MKRTFYTFLFNLFFLAIAFGQNCPQRYSDPVFNSVKITYNINYGGLKQHVDGNAKWLIADLYEPKNDTAPLRPLVFMIHGGAFLDLPIVDKQSPDIVELANDLAKRGYIVVSPDYRLAKDPLALLSTERMAQSVISAMVDINDLICYFVQTANSGNPYRIDTSRLFVGGVSAGAVLAMQGLFVDDTAELSPFYRAISNKVAAFDQRNLQDMLTHKFCGASILGGVSISGALLDSNFIKQKTTGILLIHGTADPIVPYGVAQPFSLPTLPTMYGSGAIYDKIKQTGTPVEFDSYPGLGHVPFLWLDLAKILQSLSLWNQPVLDSTKNHTAHFFYRLMGSPVTSCGNIISGIPQKNLGEIAVFPNPNKGNYTITIPGNPQKWTLQVFSVSGQLVIETQLPENTNVFSVSQDLQPGMYFIKLSHRQENETTYYMSKFTVAE